LIKYLSEPVDYKQYCELGKQNKIAKPDVCPFCGDRECLIGHGWFPRKALGGYLYDFREFWIKRFLCKKRLKTVSVHPTFSHTRKWYCLPFVIDCLVRLFEQAASICATAKEMNVPRQTLSRWKNSFATNHSEAKMICFIDTGQNKHPSPQQMLQYFRKHSNAHLHKGAASGMVRLHELYNTPLY
jgi:transposase-like protein